MYKLRSHHADYSCFFLIQIPYPLIWNIIQFLYRPAYFCFRILCNISASVQRPGYRTWGNASKFSYFSDTGHKFYSLL